MHEVEFNTDLVCGNLFTFILRYRNQTIFNIHAKVKIKIK